MKICSWLLLAGCLAVSTGCSTKNQYSRLNQNPSASNAKSVSNEEKNPILFEEEYEAHQRGEVPTYDIPVVRNAKVEQWITYFQGRGRKWFHVWLERSGRYVPVMRKILRDHSLPEDLVYLAMIESGFSSQAYSRARAVGPWQFIKNTGRLYGLKIDFWVDERRDPEKSSIAAARHLKDLYDQFQSWKLAAAAYNAGAGKVSRAIRKYKTEDFWELTKGRYLKPETRHYVPKMIAAALVAKEPEKYGFKDIEYQDPLSYDKIILNKPTNLIVLAQEAGVALDELMVINSELNHPVTPPTNVQYELRVPAGQSRKFMAAVDRLESDERSSYAAHTVKKGDNLKKIATMYHVSAKDILAANSIGSAREIYKGRNLVIPAVMNERIIEMARLTALRDDRSRRRSRASRREAVESVYQGRSKSLIDKKKLHVVRRGETLSSIARKYRTTILELKQVNNIDRNRVFSGQRLRIPPAI